jgi:hypothetical protein
MTKQLFYLLITFPRLNNYESKVLIMSSLSEKGGVAGKLLAGDVTTCPGFKSPRPHHQRLYGTWVHEFIGMRTDYIELLNR